MERGTSPCHFQNATAAAREASWVLHEGWHIHFSGLGSQRLILTDTLSWVLHSALPVNTSSAVGSVSGVFWDLNLTLILNIILTLHLTLSTSISYTRPIATHIPPLEPPWNSQHCYGFCHGDSPGPKPNPNWGSVPMGTQLQFWQNHAPGIQKRCRLTRKEPGNSPCPFQGVAALPERIPEASSNRGRSTCVALAAKVGSWRALSLVPSNQPFGETYALLWVRRLEPIGT